MGLEKYSRWRGLCFAAKSQIQYYDSQDECKTDEYHDDESLKSKLNFHDEQRSNQVSANDAPSFTLMTVAGDPSEPDAPLRLSSNMLQYLIGSGAVHPHIETMYRIVRPHCSYYVEYDDEQMMPVSLYIITRTLTRTDSIHSSIKITLSTLSTICLLSSSTSTITETLRSRLTHASTLPILLHQSPLHILRFILEETHTNLEAWLVHQWHRIELLEDSTWMTTPGGPFPRPRGSASGAEKDENGEAKGKGLMMLLRELHAVNRESRIALTVVWGAVGLCEDVGRLVGEVERLRDVVGGSSRGSEGERMTMKMKPGCRAFLEDRVRFLDGVLRGVAEKNRQLLDRMNAQINLVYSFIAQKGNEQNYRIARLTADDSRTMKTITVLTLTFLPGTMLAVSFWSSTLITIDVFFPPKFISYCPFLGNKPDFSF
ncbi:hypothetical protein DM02DRAFT_192677 [Periconia macrospinosa]|uniref:Cora-domain-containing protein n=1 Tax=Periconia macrospinosa TaxID=97972 RepID=A0A2V1D8D7_9PLEO|nr:hypothetical protein DM02DRAFT_192677 [Periconia macrospinosa]